MTDDKECYLEFKHYGKVIRFEGLNREMDMEDFHDQCKLLALAVGYQPENVKDWFEHE